jgi:ribosomal protein L37AE/L43A
MDTSISVRKNNTARPTCTVCGDKYAKKRRDKGYKLCLLCGEEQAQAVRHCIVPMAKSNYVVITDYSLLKGLNKYANA